MWRTVGGIVGGASIGMLAAATACGGKLAPLDGGATDDSGVTSLFEASVTVVDAADGGEVDATTGYDATSDAPACSYDATVRWDADLCVPPADDLFYGDPAAMEVPAGDYGVANFTIAGPWASDPRSVILYQGTTLTLASPPKEIFFDDGGVGFAFLTESTAAGSVGTVQAYARDGNIQRNAAVTVTVTQCIPTSEAVLCGDADDGGLNCGYLSDHCGGLVSCGTCDPSGPTPTCFINQCVSTPPPTCPSGQGAGTDGQCLPCTLGGCGKHCVGYCEGFEGVCTCYPYIPPTCPGEAPGEQTACLTVAQTCSWSTPCGTTQCKCDPSHLWACTTCGP